MTDHDVHQLCEEPAPDMVLIRAERRETPEALAALGLRAHQDAQRRVAV